MTRSTPIFPITPLLPEIRASLAANPRLVIMAKRNGVNSWQFPQGGVEAGESIEQAAMREVPLPFIFNSKYK